MEEASDKGLVETAFAKDLSNAHPGIRIHSIQKISQGLIAEVLHNRHIEGKKTGSDFGLIMTSPKVERSNDKLWFSQNRNGLLCQAKLKKKKHWGQLTDSQTKILPKHLKYSVIALYRYEDAELRQLTLGEWFRCENSSVDRINEHLKNNFQGVKLKSSTEILKDLSKKKIGTQDVNVMNNFIAPKENRFFELRIRWKDKGDYFAMVINSAKLKQQLEVHLTAG